MSTISQLHDQLDDMTTGSGEWINVQAPVRLALVGMMKHIISTSEMTPNTCNDITSKANNIWKEIVSLREAIAIRATRVEVAESLRLKADRSSIHYLRTLVDNKHTALVRDELREQREVHFAEHDNLLRAELSAVSTRVQNIADRITSTQAETRLEHLELKMIEYRKRRRHASDKLAKLVADVRANSSQQAETASLFLSGVARLRETLENVRVEMDHKADGTEVRQMLGTKADASDVQSLEQFFSSKSVGDRFVSLETRTSSMENQMRDEKGSKDDTVRSVAVINADIERLQAHLHKELQKLRSEVEFTQTETEKLKHDRNSHQSESERGLTSFSRRLTQVEEAVERQKPRIHDMGREQNRERTRIEQNADKLEHLTKAHTKLEGTTLSTLSRDVERLKKTIIHVERSHAQHESINGSAKHRHKTSVVSEATEQVQVQVDALVSDMRSWSTQARESEKKGSETANNVAKVYEKIVMYEKTFQKHEQSTEEMFQRASNDRSLLHERCSALETGIRSSLAVLSRPPSLKSLKSNKSKTSRRSRRSHRSIRNSKKSLSLQHDEKGGEEIEIHHQGSHRHHQHRHGSHHQHQHQHHHNNNDNDNDKDIDGDENDSTINIDFDDVDEDEDDDEEIDGEASSNSKLMKEYVYEKSRLEATIEVTEDDSTIGVGSNEHFI